MVLVQRLFVSATGTQSTIAIVLTTLVAAALFTPLRNRLQSFVDSHLKEVRDPTNQLHAFRDQLRPFLQFVEARTLDTNELVRRFLREAVDTYEAQGGAVYLGGESPFYTYGARMDNAQTKVPLVHERTLGYLALGPRVRGVPYTPRDQHALEETAAVVANAIARKQEALARER